jgi:carbamoyl-phosphate synthase large subunit
MKSNVLVLSAGRRVELVEEFQFDLKTIFPDGKVYCTDMHPQLSSACIVADGHFDVPRVTDPSYVGQILDICTQNNIGLVVPTIDTELELLSKQRHKFDCLGIHVLISEPEFVAQCRDKRKTAGLFEQLRVDQPRILDKESLSFPCFCKPYDGSCSKGALAISSEHELTPELLSDPKNMFMELVPKTYCEYTIDGYYTRNGVLKCLVPRKRLEVRGGEVSKGLTKKNFVYDYLLERVNHLPGARGCITFQLFVNEETQAIKGLEINPRFGGGYPLAYASGAKFPEYAIREFLFDEDINFNNKWEADLLMLRYDAKVLQYDHIE